MKYISILALLSATVVSQDPSSYPPAALPSGIVPSPCLAYCIGSVVPTANSCASVSTDTYSLQCFCNDKDAQDKVTQCMQGRCPSEVSSTEQIKAQLCPNASANSTSISSGTGPAPSSSKPAGSPSSYPSSSSSESSYGNGSSSTTKNDAVALDASIGLIKAVVFGFLAFAL